MLAKAWPQGMADPGGLWYGFGMRARVIGYNTRRVTEAEAPGRLEDLLDPKWKGRIAMGPPEFGTTSGHVASWYAWYGEERATEILRGLRANEIRIVASNSLAVQDVASGKADICMTDTDDVYAAQREKWPVGLKVLRHGTGGALAIPCTAALIKGGPHPEAGRRLMALLAGGRHGTGPRQERPQVPAGTRGRAAGVPGDTGPRPAPGGGLRQGGRVPAGGHDKGPQDPQGITVREATLRPLKGGPQRMAAVAGLAIWAAIVLAPLVILYASVVWSPAPANLPAPDVSVTEAAAWTAALALGLAVLATALAYVPGKILGTSGRGRTVLFWLTLAALVLPHHVLYYIWSMPLNPTAWLGAIMATQPIPVVRAVSTVLSSSVLVFGYWPLAALLLAQGWRNVDPDCLKMARLETSGWQRLVHVELPMLVRPLLVSAAACFVLIFADYATFHLARIETLGTVLDKIYQFTNSTQAVAVASWPAVVLAVAVAVVVSRHLEVGLVAAPQEEPQGLVHRRDWAVMAILLAVTLAAPMAILLSGVGQVEGMADYWVVIRDKAAWSVLAAVAAAALALAMAGGAMAAERLGRAARAVGWVAGITLLVAMFLPGSLVGAAIIQAQTVLALPPAWGEGWWIVSIGQAVRFAGVALVVLRLTRDDADRHLEEMAGIDGAGWWAAWWQVRWPRAWPLVTGAGLLVVLLSLSEVQTTMMVLPAGVPNFTQHLFNQMHYFRDRNVIAVVPAADGPVPGAGWRRW